MILSVLLDKIDILDKSYALATLELHQGGATICNPVNSVNLVFIASTIFSLYVMHYAYPDIKEILADKKSSLPTVQTFHKAVAELSEFDKQIAVKNLLKIDTKQIAKIQNILYRKVRVGMKSEFLMADDSDNRVLAVVGCGSKNFGLGRVG